MEEIPSKKGRLYTRRGVVELLRDRGIPTSISCLNKERAVGRGPEPIAHYGRRELFAEADALAWGATLISETPTRMNVGQRKDEAADEPTPRTAA